MVREYNPNCFLDIASRMERDIMARVLDSTHDLNVGYSERQGQLAQIEVDIYIDGRDNTGKLY